VRATGLVDGLVVHKERMRRNLEQSGGLCFSEAVLLALVKKGLPRQKAYELVQPVALALHAAGSGSFRELLGKDAEIAKRLSPAELDACFDLDHHLRHASMIIERALGGATP